MTRQDPVQPPNLLSKIVAFIVGLGVLALGFMFSLVALAIVVLGGLAVWAWLWWKTRAIRQQMRAPSTTMPHDFSMESGGGQIIDGEVIRDDATVGRTHNTVARGQERLPR